jgi:hypothetical protein
MPKTIKRAQITLRHVREYHPAQFLPFYLPNQSRNKISISSVIEKRGAKYPIVSFRNSIFMGMPAETMIFPEDIIIHYLKDEHGVIMSTIPQEMEQHARQLQNAHGKVLVGGLGLGLSVSLLQENPKVTEITVVEINPDIIALIKPHLDSSKTNIIYGDLHGYLKKCSTKFDFGYFDIWRGTSEYDFSTIVWPLRRLATGIVEQLECWNEDEMIGQIEMGCLSIIAFRHTDQGKQFLEIVSPKERKAWNSRWPFIRYLQLNKPADKKAFSALRSYLKALKNPTYYDRTWAQYNKQPTKEKP